MIHHIYCIDEYTLNVKYDIHHTHCAISLFLYLSIYVSMPYLTILYLVCYGAYGNTIIWYRMVRDESCAYGNTIIWYRMVRDESSEVLLLDLSTQYNLRIQWINFRVRGLMPG